MPKECFVYILTNKLHTVLYTGVTNNPGERIDAHKSGGGSLFTRKYNVTKLVHFETFGEIEEASRREKQLKRWKRVWKDELVGKSNPHWEELVT
jgi:putative endonuclease